jgi:hypothetical protein
LDLTCFHSLRNPAASALVAADAGVGRLLALPLGLIPQQPLIDHPAAATAERLGEFRNDAGGWLPSEIIEAAIDVGVTVRSPRRAAPIKFN